MRKQQLRILTSSFKHQRSGHDRDLKTAVKTLNQSMMSNPFASVGDGAVSRDHASICLGHFDVREYSELSPLLTHAFQDVDAALRPFSDGLSVGGPDEVFLQELLAGYPTYPVHYNKSEEGQLRQDLIFIKGHREVQPVEAGRVGRRSVETVIDTDPDERLFDKRSKDGKVYPSNHLGVFCKVAF